jgi:cytochrome c oxidase subunit 1
MTTTQNRPATADAPRTAQPDLTPSKVGNKGNVILDMLTTTDHKKIGYMYLASSVAWFCIGGVMALLIRAQLFAPGMELIATKDQYNQLFTMHGTIMLLMFATPLFSGFANALLPLQIGTADVAFPRLNAFAFWLYTFGAAGLCHRKQTATARPSGRTVVRVKRWCKRPPACRVTGTAR